MNDEKKDETQGMRLMVADDDGDDDESKVQQEVRADSRSARAGHWASQKTKLNTRKITRRKTQISTRAPQTCSNDIRRMGAKRRR